MLRKQAAVSSQDCPQSGSQIPESSQPPAIGTAPIVSIAAQDRAVATAAAVKSRAAVPKKTSGAPRPASRPDAGLVSQPVGVAVTTRLGGRRSGRDGATTAPPPRCGLWVP